MRSGRITGWMKDCVQLQFIKISVWYIVIDICLHAQCIYMTHKIRLVYQHLHYSLLFARTVFVKMFTYRPFIKQLGISFLTQPKVLIATNLIQTYGESEWPTGRVTHNRQWLIGDKFAPKWVTFLTHRCLIWAGQHSHQELCFAIRYINFQKFVNCTYLYKQHSTRFMKRKYVFSIIILSSVT